MKAYFKDPHMQKANDPTLHQFKIILNKFIREILEHSI